MRTFMMPRFLTRTLLAVLLLGMLTCVLGCFNPFHPLIATESGVSEPPPVPNSPQNTLRLLEWAYNHKAIDEYRELFTEEYRFVFSDHDSNGRASRDVPWTRADGVFSITRP